MFVRGKKNCQAKAAGTAPPHKYCQPAEWCALLSANVQHPGVDGARGFIREHAELADDQQAHTAPIFAQVLKRGAGMGGAASAAPPPS